jgi:Sel1 repeat
MEVANEAAAPALPKAAALHEGEVIAESPSLASAPSPPSPEAPPIAVAPPATAAKDVADEVKLFQRRTLPAVLAPHFWAGLLGAGAGCWLLGTIGAFAAAGVTRRPAPEIHIALAFTTALVVVLARGYRAPLQSYVGLAGRLFGSFVFGSLWSLLAIMIVILIDSVQRLRDLGSFVVIALFGALMSCLALGRLYGIGAERPRRMQIAASSAAVLFLCFWPVLPGLRCQLGFAQGCRAAGEASFQEGDTRAAAELAAKGCAGEDPLSCRLAGRAYQGEGPARNLRLAEELFREGCALGDPSSCASVHVIELERRCDRYGATACAELGQAYQSGEGVDHDIPRAARLYRKACLLGAEDGCQRANQYR